MNISEKNGSDIYQLAKDLYPINRSITGDGVRKSLDIIKNIIPDLEIVEVASGTKVFDWQVPDEWNVNEAWVKGPDGNYVVNFSDHNLHLLGYSHPIDVIIELDEFQNHLYSSPEMPDAIPYVTSYYSSRWGFCLSEKLRNKLKPGQYHAYIDSSLKPGSLTYGELVLPGNTKEEIFLTTYICHPSMANNELSGPCVTTYLAKWLMGLEERKYTYRIVFIPETIGSITYLSKHVQHLKSVVKAGFNITCIGDEKCYSYLPSRNGETISDKVALHVLKHIDKNFIKYTYLDRGSDERQYCSPGVDLPIASIMRSKYGEYPEYHTSLDDLSFISPEGLYGGYKALKTSIQILEINCTPKVEMLCEPQLGKHGLYPTISTKETRNEVSKIMNFIAYCDGKNDLVDIANKISEPVWELFSLYCKLKKKNIVS